MAVTIVGPPDPETVVIPQSSAVLVELRRLWGPTDTVGWYVEPSIQFVSATAGASGSEMGTAVFVRRYGEVAQPYQLDYVPSEDRDSKAVYWIGHWVRVKFYTAAGSEVVWTGRIAGETREVFGSGTAAGGKQVFTAYDASYLLSKIDVADSLWLRDKREDEAIDVTLPDGLQATHVQQRMGWVPTANARGPQHWMVGNRINHVDGDNNEFSWFGGTLLWNMRQLVEHLLSRYANNVTPNDSPKWYLSGQVKALEGITRSVPFSDREDLLSILRRIIHPQYGIDFKIEPVEESASIVVPFVEAGFSIHVFALTDEEFSVGGVAAPTNPDRMEFTPASERDVESVRVVSSEEHAVGRIRVFGRRMVAVCTLNRLEASGAVSEAPTLVPKWKESDRVAYVAGTGNLLDDGVDHDKARQATRFEGVYQAFGAPEDWNRVLTQTNPVQIFKSGKVELEQASVAAPVYQDKIRQTLPWIPFQGDRTTPLGSHDTFESEMMSPQAWLWDEEEDRYVAADQAGMSVAALQNEFGVRLQCSPNHLLALNRWSVDASSETEPKYDYDRMAVTIAFETDHRLGDGALVFERVGGVRPHDGTMDIIDEDAELWFAAPGTVYGVDADGALLRTDAGLFTVLRNDSERLAAVLAVAIARYTKTRMRAEIALRGFFPYSLLIGKILTVIEQSGRSIHGAITAVEYQGGEEPRTIIRAGYAR